MSNLGAYQWMTTMSKKVGGPFQLLGMVAVGGYIIVRGVEAGGKYVYNFVKEKAKSISEKVTYAPKFKVMEEGISNEGIHFNIGDEFYVLETDDKAVLIAKIGDPNSPYFIQKDLFDQISGQRKNAVK